MIDFDEVGFSYDGSAFALDGVSLHVEPGEFVCVLGGNGSGKSTLAKHVNALLVPDRGEVRVLGLSTADPGNLYSIRSNAGMVFQNPDDQIVASLVEDDVAFGPENLGLPAETLRERVTAALARVGLQGFEAVETSSLSGGQKQRVAIAGALAMDPKILVLDEASAMLDPRGRAGLMRVCRALNGAGMTVVMITHFMEEAAQAGRVVVLDGGTVAAQGRPADVLSDVSALEELCLDVPFAAKAAQRLRQAGVDVGVCVGEDELVDGIAHALGGGEARVQRAPAAAPPPSTPGAAPQGGELVRFEQVSYTYEQGLARSGRAQRRRGGPSKAPGRPQGAGNVGERQGSEAPDGPQGAAGAAEGWGNAPGQQWALREIDFCLHEGEFFGIAGHTGSGKSTLLQHMNGLLHPTSGRVLVGGANIADKAAAARARQQVGLVFQYPEHQLFAATVFEDVAFGPRNMGCGEADAAERYEQAMALVGLDAQGLRDASPFELSGGQQRRVALAGVLAMQPATLILDEPAAGLDPKARAEFLALVKTFHEQGMTIAMVSHNMDDLAALCDRILVLNQGRQHALGAPALVFGDAQACAQVGLDVPSAQRVANALAQRGVDLGSAPGGLFDMESLVGAVAARHAQKRG